MKAEASVWRLSPAGRTLMSVPENLAAQLADDSSVIYFYAELEGSEELTHNSETMLKVFDALKDIGLTKNQILSAINSMQSNGLYFRESV